MVEKTLKLRVCNICERPGVPVRSYILVEGDRKRQVDLCEEHGKVVEELMATGEPVEEARASGEAPARVAMPARTPAKKAAAKKAVAKKAVGGRGRRSTKVLTVEEIEALRRGE